MFIHLSVFSCMFRGKPKTIKGKDKKVQGRAPLPPPHPGPHQKALHGPCLPLYSPSEGSTKQPFQEALCALHSPLRGPMKPSIVL